MLTNKSENSYAVRTAVYKKQIRAIGIGMAIWGTVMVVLGIVFLIVKPFENGPDTSEAVSVLAIGIVMAMIGVVGLPFLMRLGARRQMKSETVDEYTFGESTLTVKSTGASESGETTFDYAAFDRVEEYPEFWLLYRGQQFFTVLKSGMQSGSAEELSAFLRSHVGKYKIKK